ncbi:DUF551 domain-containing protein [Pseudomonas sp. zbq_18]|uniref:DUF551 domain-containing protein n=1 Tax=Pseudomonas sp. zbq_18 TaxID=3367251 RepID=UPI00370C7397
MTNPTIAVPVELLPCPFCGGSASIKNDGDLRFIVCGPGTECKGTGLTTFFVEEKSETAIAAWNRRTAQPADHSEQPSGIYSSDPLACSGCISGCFRCRAEQASPDHLPPLIQCLRENGQQIAERAFDAQEAKYPQPQPSAAQSAPDEREAFEAWIEREAGEGAAKRWPTDNGPGYANDRVQDYRTGWVECLAWQRAQSAPAGTECSYCQGHGEVTRQVGQTPETYDFWNEPCPECAGTGAAPAHPAPRNEQAGEWIACNERLPTVKQDGAMVTAFVCGVVTTKATRSVRDLFQAAEEDGEQCAVTHWMPLPAPPALSQQADGGAA